MSTVPPTQEDIDAKTAEYKAAKADRETKGETAHTDAEARDAAIETAGNSYEAYVEALQKEHQIEDELEAMQEAYEPPPIPTEPFSQGQQQKGKGKP